MQHYTIVSTYIQNKASFLLEGSICHKTLLKKEKICFYK